MQSDAKTVDAYIAQLPLDRQEAINAVRKVIKANIDPAFEEGMLYGMIGYYVPHSLFPAGYHCDPSKPLSFAGLASQKNHLSLYIMTLYGDSQHLKLFQQEWAKSGKKLDMGKCCIRFKKVEDLEMSAVANAVKRVRASEYVAQYERTLGESKKSKSAKKAVKGPSASKKKATDKKLPATKVVSAKKKAVKKTATKKSVKKKSVARSKK